MRPLTAFIRTHLAPGDRLGEVLFGLIMALGFTGAVRLGLEEPDNLSLFQGIFGCNLAWAIVDGVMYVLGELFERGRRVRVTRDVLRAPTESEALERIARELDRPLLALTSPEERLELHRWVLTLVRREPPSPSRLRAEDLLGGVAVGLIIVLATLPVVLPFLLGFLLELDPGLAVRLSNLIALALLFLLGTWWGRVVGASPWRIGLGLCLVGIILVLITIALGG